jgi:deoxyhypusine synthase
VKRGSDWKPLDFKGIKTRSLQERKSKVEVTRFASPLAPGSTFKSFCDSLPQFLAAQDVREIVSRIVAAVRSDKMVLLGMGAHPIKVGLNPIIIDLMERGIIRGLAMNGAGIVHDVEIAMAGKTSEEVAEGLSDGSFGVTEETAEFINAALKDGQGQGWGCGRAVGKALQNDNELPYREQSICAAAYRLDIPLTVHIAIGTDVVHIHPSADGSILGEMTYRDFRLFASLVAALEGGVYINVGSAVIMPEVFLKALSAARNLGHKVEDFATLNMDFIQHYRPTQNVVQRPTIKGGKGFALTGHHEIMIPLLAAAIIEGIEDKT